MRSCGGFAGAAGAAAGVGIVVASFTVSSLVIAWADSVHPTLVLPVGMFTYIVKFTAIGFAMAAVVASGWDGLRRWVSASPWRPSAGRRRRPGGSGTPRSPTSTSDAGYGDADGDADAQGTVTGSLAASTR